MRTLTITCDRCGKKITGEANTSYSIEIIVLDNFTGARVRDEIQTRPDLCKDCSEDIRRFFQADA